MQRVVVLSATQIKRQGHLIAYATFIEYKAYMSGSDSAW